MRRGGGGGGAGTGGGGRARRVQSQITTSTRNASSVRKKGGIGRSQSEFIKGSSGGGGRGGSRLKANTFNAGSTPRAGSGRKKPKAASSRRKAPLRSQPSSMSSFSSAKMFGAAGDGDVLDTPLQRRPPNALHAGATPKAGGQFFYDDDEETPVRRPANSLNAGATPRAASGGDEPNFNAETRFDEGDGDGAAPLHPTDAEGDDAPHHAKLKRRKSFEQHRLEEKLHSSDRLEREEAKPVTRFFAEHFSQIGAEKWGTADPHGTLSSPDQVSAPL